MTAEQPEKETLVSLLKDKAKELKLVQKKLGKVEDKFVETHKLQKALIRDRDTFQQFLKVVFEAHPKILEETLLPDTPDNYGLYDINQLQEFYIHIQSLIDKDHIIEREELKKQIDEQ